MLCEADKINVLSHCVGNFIVIWIPAYAGMTQQTGIAGMRKLPADWSYAA